MIDTTTTDKRPVKLSELTKEIAEVINQHFGQKFYWVIAEVTGHRLDSRKGYHYFDLAEKQGEGQGNITKIACNAFAVGAQAIKNFESFTGQPFRNNIEVMVRIRVDYSMEYGLKTILQDIDVAFTIGNLERLKQQTLQRLLNEESAHVRRIGDQIVSTNRGLPLPLLIKGIALITSRESEGYTDFSHTLLSNRYGYRFHLFKFFCKVQSDSAGAEMVGCLKTIFTQYRQYIDVVVICRGGGAQTDFLPFNQFNLCRAVARFPIPIITGIGHHSNQSLVDVLAGKETKTPTQAAEFIIDHCHAVDLQVLTIQQSITIQVQQLLARQQNTLSGSRMQIIGATRGFLKATRDSLIHRQASVMKDTHQLLGAHRESLAGRKNAITSGSFRIAAQQRNRLVQLSSLISNKPASAISIRTNLLGSEAQKLRSFTKKFIARHAGYLGHYQTLFRHLDVEKTLAKGFAIVRKNGRVITDPALVGIRDELDIQLKHTTITTTVTEKHDGTGTDL